MRKFLPLLLLLFAPSARCANVPLAVNHCFVQLQFSVSTLDCNLTNTTSGDVIVMGAQGASNFSGTGVTVITPTATETMTCPAGAKNDHDFSGISTVTQFCYVVTSSSHSTFNVSITVTSTQPAPTAYSLGVVEWRGLGTFDSGAATSAASFSVSTTTANTDEMILEYCAGRDTDITSGTGFAQVQGFGSSDTLSGSQDPRGFHGAGIFASSGSHTSSCTANNSFGRDQIVTIAFQQSSPPATPTINIIQTCGMNAVANGGAQGGCSLSNTVAGNKVITLAISQGTAPFGNVALVTTEASTCVANTYVTHVYAGLTYFTVICYVDTSSSHGVFSGKLSYTGFPGSNTQTFFMFEVSGTTTGIDSGSATACVATSCSYTTAANNEFTVFVAGDTQTGGMVPGNSFVPLVSTKQTSNVNETQGSVAYKQTASSGSNTASYSGAAAPLMAVLAFGTTASPLVPRRKGWVGE